MFSLVLIISLGTLTNFWVYSIFRDNFLIGLLLVVESTCLYFLSAFAKTPKTIQLLSLVILFILSCYFFAFHFNKNFLEPTPAELAQTQKRYNFYPNRFLAYSTKLDPVTAKINQRISQTLDLTAYFASKKLIDEQKFSPFLAPVFLMGFLSFLRNPKKIVVVFALLIILVAVLTSEIFVFSILTLFLSLGLTQIVKFRP